MLRRAVAGFLNALLVVLLSVARLRLFAWIALAISIPVAIAVAVDTITCAEELWATQSPLTYLRGHYIALELGASSAHRVAYLCYLNASVDGERLSYVATLITNVSRPCVGLDLAKALGSNHLRLFIGGRIVEVKGFCSKPWLRPFVAVPMSIASPVRGCIPVSLGRGSSALAEALSALATEVSSSFSSIKLAAMLAYSLVLIPACVEVLKGVESSLNALRFVGFPRLSEFAVLAIATSVCVALSTLLGIAMGTVASHAALTIASAVTTVIPCRPLALGNAPTYLGYAELSALVATSVAYAICGVWRR